MSKKYFIDDFIEQMKDGSICTSIPSCDLYDKLKDKSYYKKYEDIYYESDRIREEEANKLVKEQDEKFEFIKGLDFEEYYFNSQEENDSEDEDKGIYIQALKRKYDNRKKDLDIDYMYMYELYLNLKRISSLAEEQHLKKEYIEDLIDKLNSNIEISKDLELIYSYNINTDNFNYIIERLENIISYVEYNCFNEAFLEIEKIIDQCFRSKDLIYKNNRNSKFIKRKNRENEYLELLNSYEYKIGMITKRDIAKKLEVSPAAVTQFCKRHKIP